MMNPVPNFIEKESTQERERKTLNPFTKGYSKYPLFQLQRWAPPPMCSNSLYMK
jgi:hypothetical protein